MSNFRKFLATFWDIYIVATKLCVDNPIGHINWYAVLETKRWLLRPNTNATWITTHQIEIYSTPYMYTLFATSTKHIDLYVSTCAHLHTLRARTMRAYANALIRIASHANAFLMRHASIRIRYLGVFRVRYARICAHSHAMRAHSHRMRSHSHSHSHRMRSHRMRMRAFKGNLCVSGTIVVITSAERRRLCFHLCWFVSLFVCLSVSIVTGKCMDGFSWNFQDILGEITGIISKIWGIVCVTPYIHGFFLYSARKSVSVSNITENGWTDFHEILRKCRTWNNEQIGTFSRSCD